jgi:hypothetical protein
MVHDDYERRQAAQVLDTGDVATREGGLRSRC